MGDLARFCGHPEVVRGLARRVVLIFMDDGATSNTMEALGALRLFGAGEDRWDWSFPFCM